MRRNRSNKYRRGGFNRHKPRSRRDKIKTFDPSMFVKSAIPTKPLQVVPIKNEFSDFPLNPTLQKNIDHKGYKTPTPIQDQIIPLVLGGKDVVGIANTGTGKTAAFLIPLIEKVIRHRSSRILIITPTRELAAQIQAELQDLSYSLNIQSTLVIGGLSIRNQIRQLQKSPQFIIGTPGRIKDLAQKRELQLDTMKTIVLDEVDRMLDMGFIGDMKLIISLLSSPRHSLFFSATLPDDVRVVMENFLNDPIIMNVKLNDSIDNIDQDVVMVGDRSKIDLLEEMLNKPEFSKVLIFGGSKWKLNRLEKNLRGKGYRVSAIHGNKSQQHRQRVLGQFKSNALQALLATDVVSRGIDIDDISHVINFDLPQTYEAYIHRIGRTGRASKTGKAITFID